MGVVGGEELQGWEKTSEAGGERILVSVRLRPLNAKESARNDVSEWECINDNTIIFKNSLQDRSLVPTAYSYDRVFQCKCSTKQVYEEAAKEVALSVISGINSSIFAYGQTSSGKTYTMTGITEYTIADIYDYIQKHEERVFILKFSAMEIYNEAVRDLLSADGTPLRLLDDPERGTIVEKLTEETLRDWNHLQELLAVCEAQRQIGETNLNETSSRSHQILRLTIESSAHEFFSKESSSTLSASVNFVDLAGSERASQALSAGTRLKEGCHINRSLLTLGTVIRKLSKGRGAHIPYRDSKLTRILQSSLGGNSRTAIICTMSPARSHTEQSRNTLLFATCAKDVATNAQVNVVMSDKALVRHLQRELARMEGELSGMGPTITASHSELLMREKDIQIQKMEKEIKELIQQRDLAQSRLEDLLRVVGDDQASRLWAEFDHPPASHASNACEDELSVSGSSGVADCSLDFGLSKFMASQYSKEYSDAECNEDCLQLAEIPEDQMLFDGTSPRFSNSSPKSVGSIPHQDREEISQETNDDVEDQCKEVRCIETEELNTNRKEESNNISLPEGNEMSPPLTLCNNTCVKDQESESTERAIELQPVGTDSTYGALEKQLHDVQKMIDGLVRPSDESSPWPSTVDLSSSRSSYLSRSKSCRAALMTSSNSPLFQDAEQNENTPPGGFEKDFPGRPAAGDFQRRSCALNFETEALSRECSQSSEHSASIDVLKSQNIKATTEENITSIRSFVAGLKEMAQLQYQKKLVNGQEVETKANEDFQAERTSKDVGLDPMQNPLESPSWWPMEFKRQQREIIELWDACNVSLVHRTYFFLLFKGDPADSIYMEVELRRLSFLKNTFSQGNIGTQTIVDGCIVKPTSSMKALRREREMLSKHMQKRFSEEERGKLYKKWGIGLDTKQRKLQLACLVWTQTNDMDHVKESANIVANLVGFLEPGQAPKEMFGLSFRPQWTSRRSQSWKNSSMSSLLLHTTHLLIKKELGQSERLDSTHAYEIN